MAEKSQRPEYEVKVAKTKDEIEAAYDLRLEVFHVEQGFPADTEIDEYDPISVHFLLYTKLPSPPPSSVESILPEILQPTRGQTTLKPIGTIRLTLGIGKVSRLAVDKEYRKFGFGRILLQAVDDHVKSLTGEKRDEMKDIIQAEGGREMARLKLHAQMPVIQFYERYGYRPIGDVFDEEGAPHQKMIKDVPLL